MRCALIDAREAPPRPALPRGGKRRLEMDEVVVQLAPGMVAQIEAAEAGNPRLIRSLLLEAAVFVGRRVELWEDADGVVYAKLAGTYGVAATSAAHDR